MATSKINLRGSEFFKNIADKVNEVKETGDFDFKNIDINLLVPSKENFFEIRDVEKLADDITRNGLYHNLVVRQLEDGKYEIISGERRYNALKLLGKKRVPCQVRDEIDDTSSQIMLIEANWQSRALTEKEKMESIARLKKLYEEKKANGEKIVGKVREKIGKDVGLSGMQVQRYMNINDKLIPELKDMLGDKIITLVDSVGFAKMSEEQQRAIHNFLKENINASKDEIKKLKEEVSSKDNKINTVEKEKEDIEIEKAKLIKVVDDLKEALENKDTELNSVNENIDNIKRELEEEASKQANEQNKEEIKRLNETLARHEKEKVDIVSSMKEMEKQKDLEIQKLSSRKDTSNEETKKNIELEVMLKNADNITKEIVKISSSIKEVSEENKSKLKDLKTNLKQILDVIEKLEN